MNCSNLNRLKMNEGMNKFYFASEGIWTERHELQKYMLNDLQ